MPPSVQLHPTHGAVATGSTVQLVCTSNSSCGDGVAWTKDGKSVDSGGGAGSHGNVLTLHTVRAEDSGVYCCEGGVKMSDCVNLRVEGEST